MRVVYRHVCNVTHLSTFRPSMIDCRVLQSTDSPPPPLSPQIPSPPPKGEHELGHQAQVLGDHHRGRPDSGRQFLRVQLRVPLCRPVRRRDLRQSRHPGQHGLRPGYGLVPGLSAPMSEGQWRHDERRRKGSGGRAVEEGFCAVSAVPFLSFVFLSNSSDSTSVSL
jgi:hypothetical protein